MQPAAPSATTCHLLRLRPIEERDERGEATPGILIARRAGEPVMTCATLELPWLDNQNSVSCIPRGTYPLRHREPYESGSFDYPHFLVEEVPRRRFICIHRGNYTSQIKGCILVGRRHADLNGDGVVDVASSTETLRQLRAEVPARTTLEVRDAIGPDFRRLAGVAPPELDLPRLADLHLEDSPFA